MDALLVSDLRVGDCVIYQHERSGDAKAYVEDIKYEAGVPTVVLGTEDVRMEVACEWCVPGIKLRAPGPR